MIVKERGLKTTLWNSRDRLSGGLSLWRAVEAGC